VGKEKKVRAYKNRREEMKIYYQKTKDLQKAIANAWHAAKRAREKEEPKENEESKEEDEEYNMTEQEREKFNLRWRLLFNRSPFECQEYMFEARDECDGYSNK
jgi:septal ring factor EnvC (AmiA/AmiB activator)